MSKRRLKGTGGIFRVPGSSFLWMQFNGVRRSSGLPDTPENRRIIGAIMDKAYMRMQLDGIDPFRSQIETVTIASAFDEFMATYAQARQPKTQQWYQQSFEYFFDRHRDKRLETLSVQTLMEKALSHQAKGKQGRVISPTAKHTYLRGAMAFLRWAHRKRYLKDAIDAAHLASYVEHVPRKEPKVYTDAELTRIVARLRAEGESEVALIVELGAVTGFRIHELLELRRSWFREDHIVVESKDHRRIERFPLWSEAREVISRIPMRDDDMLFGLPPGQNSSDRIRWRFAQAMKAEGIEADGRSLHVLRKTFISRVCRSGMPLDVAAKVCRCTVAVMMEHYRHFSVGELTKRMDEMVAIVDRP
jgi:integrase